MNKNKILHIRITEQLAEDIRQLAEKESKTMSEYVIDLIKADKIRKEIKK